MKLVQLGYISRPHGFRGAFVVQGHTGKESALGYLKTVLVGTSAQASQPFSVEEAAWMPSGWKLKLQGWDTEQLVKERRGQFVFANREHLADTQQNEFYTSDLIGFSVINSTTGKTVGTFRGIETSGQSNSQLGADRWVIDTGTSTFLVPASGRFIQKVDTDARIIVMQNIDELL